MITFSTSVATREDLPRLEKCASEFYAASKALKVFDLQRFVHVWEGLLPSSGVIFKSESSGEIVGAIGGIHHEDLYSGAKIATEFFWFVRPEFRGCGIALYRLFEEWAKTAGCSEIRMAALCDVGVEKVERVYRSLGFQPTERLYAKELV